MIYRRLFDFPSFRPAAGPLEVLERLQRQLDRLSEVAASPHPSAPAGVFPLVNLSEDKDNYYLRAELPGVKADALDIQATANTIAIAGEREIEAEQGVRYHRREREPGKFSRVIGLPDDIDPDNVTAKLKDGILTIVVSKAKAAKPKQIVVKSS